MNKKDVPVRIAIIPVIFLVITLAYAILVLEADPHIPLFTSALFTCLIAIVFLKDEYYDLEKGMIDTIQMAMQANLILMIIGMVIGTWILSGIVPTMIYYGLKIISPSVFLLTALIMCSIVSLATGSSWTTAGTIGIALIGIGTPMGIPVPVIAGAVISGAYFGDKMSPLSDTTNLAPAMAGSTLFEHIRHMIYTTGPSYLISAVLFTILGFRYAGAELDLHLIGEMNAAFEATFSLNPLLLLVPVITIGLVVAKVPAIPGLFIGALLGGLGAIIFEGASIGDMVNALHYGYEAATESEFVNELLSRGGMDSMMWTISLIICAMLFGGAMEKTGMLGALANQILKLAKSTGSLVIAVIFTCIGINVISGDQYLSIVIPGRMFREEFLKRGLDPVNLSRCLEDSGTLTSPFIPWNTCGATMINFLGLDPWTYIPYSFLNWINPLISILWGFTGFSMKKLTPEKIEELKERGVWLDEDVEVPVQ